MKKFSDDTIVLTEEEKVVVESLSDKIVEMIKEGKSTDEIREFLENKGKYHNNARVAAGIGEALTGSMGGVGHAAATAVGAYDALEKNRKKFKED